MKVQESSNNKVESMFTFGNANMDKLVLKEYQPIALMKQSDHGMVITALHIKTGKTKVIKMIKCSKDTCLELMIQTEMAALCPDTVLAVEKSFQGDGMTIMVMEHWGFPFMPSKWRDWNDVDLGADGKDNKRELEKSSMNDLFGYIECYGKLSENMAITILYKVVSTLSVLHTLGYEYNDLKDENVLLNETLENIKLVDFGSVMELGKSRDMFKGTMSHAPPEVFNNRMKRLPKGQDIWCIGRLLYVMVTGEEFIKPKSTTFQDLSPLQRHIELMENLSEDVRTFLEGCLEMDPEKRFKMDDVLGSKIWDRISKPKSQIR